MNADSQSNNKRIAKNTMLLYFRMFLLMIIGLYTSRVTLQVLGVEDYGIYNVVGGFVVMFNILTLTLTNAISRFITVELGKKNFERLKVVFSTSLNVQLLMSVVVAVFAEIIGIWFLDNKMVIPDGRYDATFWVLQFSILNFILGLINVPYNSVIVAHEKMSAFAYISLLEAALKLLVVYLLLVSPFDKLIVYAALLVSVQAILRLIYGVYCHKHFDECNGKMTFDVALFKDMWKFAGWNLLGSGAYTLNNQGVNMLMNVFFGVVVNAARGVANQVNGVLNQFVNSFTIAINPQITKSYSSGNKEYTFQLVCEGAKFSYLLLYCISLPIMLESDMILKLWLGNPPEHSSEFLIWTILSTLTVCTGNSLVTLIMAHGNIKKYQIIISCIGIAPFPLSWILFIYGYSAVWGFIVYFIIYYLLIYVRLWLVNSMTGIPISLYLKNVILKTHLITLLSIIPTLPVIIFIQQGFIRLLITSFVSVITCLFLVYMIGLSSEQRENVCNKIIRKFK